jgi:amino acid adenylation domain-containing protein
MTTDKRQKKLILSIVLYPSEDAADIHFTCSKCSIPEPAAAQLFRIAIAYLKAGDDDDHNTTQSLNPSVLNFPPAFTQPLPLPWDAYCEPSRVFLAHSAFERRAAEFPDHPAIDFLSSNQSRTTISYGEALCKVDRIAKGLNQLLAKTTWAPVRGTQRVFPIFMATCPELYLTVLAILRAGHAFCPLPVDAPEDRIHAILGDLSAPIVLGVGKRRFGVQDTKSFDKLAHIVWTDVTDFSANLPQAPECAIETSQLSGDDLAYVYYTSGSTGMPKGVQISHLAATCAVSANAAALPDITNQENLRWFQLAVPTFDAFILDVFFTFSAGGTICAAERNLTLTDLEGTMNSLEVNTTHTVPSLAMTLRPERLTSLRNLLCIGEKISNKVVNDFAPNTTTPSRLSRSLLNLYGPTEATINVTTQIFTSRTRGSIIGQALPTCSVLVLDDATFEALPAGLAGHLAIAGPQLSHGYLNRPVENAKQFVYSKEFGQIYLTGDKARIVWSEQGDQVLECLGRIQDGQVKINGRRIELEEIDSVLAASTFVIEAATVMADPSGAQIYACIVPQPGSTEIQVETSCREIARQNLPGWMNPHHYFFFSALARNVSGKIDRNSLRKSAQALLLARTSQSQTNVAKTSPKESPAQKLTGVLKPLATKELLPVICNLLQQSVDESMCEITPTTSLFALGFDSLRAIIFLQAARDHGIYELGIQDMLKGLTPTDLVRLVERRRKIAERAAEKSGILAREYNQHESLYNNETLRKRLLEFDDRCRLPCADKLGLRESSIEAVLPTTYIQTRMVANFLRAEEQSQPKPWVEHFVYEMPASIDSHRFQQAVNTILSRYDCFRTVFTLIDDPMAPAAQIVLKASCPEATIPGSNVYCTGDETCKNNMFERMIIQVQRAADEQMSLSRPPLAVSFVRSTSSGRCSFVLSIFHGNYDGFSLRLMRQDIMAEYESRQASERTFMDSVVKMHFGEDQEKTLSFWISKLAVTPYYVLAGVPCDTITSKINGLSPDPSTIVKDEESPVSVIKRRSNILYADLEYASKHQLRTTPLSVFQASWALVLVECQQKMDTTRPKDEPFSYDVTFGSTLHGRYDQTSQICMGPVIATVPVCIAGDTTDVHAEKNRQMCNILATEHAEALEHLQIPCPSLEFAQSSTRFDTTLILHKLGEDEPNQPSDFPGFEEGDAWGTPYRGSDFCMPVVAEIYPRPGGVMEFQCTFQNKSPKYPWLNAATAAQLMELFDRNLAWIMANPDEVFDHRRRDRV